MGGATQTYSYDGNGQRVQKAVVNGATTVYVYDAFGQPSAEYDNAVLVTAPCKTCYLAYDHLGSLRMVMDSYGQVMARRDYLPFGEEIPANTAGRDAHFGANGDNITQKFTGKERDAESGLDYFGARYYSSAPGRFTSS